MSNFSRRDFLKTGAITGLFAGTVVAGTGCVNGAAGRSERWMGSAKNVIIMVSDGMSSGTLAMAEQLKQVQYGQPTQWLEMYRNNSVKRSLMDMASASNTVTDSGAAASSWGCGVRIPNGRINVDSNDQDVTPIFTYFRNGGKKTGLVTTTRVTHATPAGFIANSISRNDEDLIAAQMLERGADVIMGGGHTRFSAESREDGRDLYTEFASKGYTVARTKAEMNQAGDQPLLGIFQNEHMPYTVDHINDETLKRDVPTLAEMTEVALKKLNNRNGFILQVEGGRVDHAAHGNDAAGLLYDQLAFDDAVAVAYKFASENPDTLLIVTTDHGNANPAYNGTSDDEEAFRSVYNTTASSGVIRSELDRNSSLSRIREVIEAKTTIAIDNDQASMLRSAIRGEYREAFGRMNGADKVLSRILSNYNGICFTSGSHTSDLVELAAMGPGSESLDGFIKNTDLFKLMVKAAGVHELA